MRLVKSLSAYRALLTIHDKEEARMARTAIQPVDMADPRPRYTHGWRVGNSVYVAGQLALDKDGNLVGPNDIRAQSRRVLENMRRVLETAGASLGDVVKITVFVTDIRYREGYGEVRQEFFAANPPASTLVQVACLAISGALIEIEAVAVIE
jgi:reactive intermediate/imine deaminase